MIDWTKERTDKNYCGYCIGSPPSANCNGSCFVNSDINRVNHILTMLKKIPEQIEELKKKEQEYIDALKT